MQECREEYGDNFSVKFMSFERPMVMISDPAAIKALYTERAHGLPPGREVVLSRWSALARCWCSRGMTTWRTAS